MTSYAQGDLVETVEDIELGGGGTIPRSTPGTVARDSSDGVWIVSVTFKGDDPDVAYRNVPKSTIRKRRERRVP